MIKINNGCGKYYLPAITSDDYLKNYWYYVSLSTSEKNKIDKTKRNNQPPQNGITLDELAEDPNGERKILNLYISVDNMKNKSCIFCLYGLGYSFTWTELRILGTYYKNKYGIR